MNAQEAREKLSAYLDRELDERERRELDALLAADPALQAELEELRQTVEMVRSLPKVSAPAGFARRVERAIAASGRRARARWLRPAALAAAACLVVGFLAALVSTLRAPREAARAVSPDTRTAVHRKAPAPPSGPSLDKKRGFAFAREQKDETKELAQEALRLKSAPAIRRDQVMVQPSLGAPAQPRKSLTAEAAGSRVAPHLGKSGAGHIAADSARPQVVAKAHRVVVEGYGGRAPAPQAGDRELLRAIMEPSAPAEARRARSKGLGPAAAEAKAAEREGTLDIALRYRDLATTLERLARAFEAARVSYVVQPLGSGEFVVETSGPAPLLTSLARRLAGQEEEAPRQAALNAAQQSHPPQAGGATQGAGGRLRLVVRFTPSRAAAEQSPAVERHR